MRMHVHGRNLRASWQPVNATKNVAILVPKWSTELKRPEVFLSESPNSAVPTPSDQENQSSFILATKSAATSFNSYWRHFAAK